MDPTKPFRELVERRLWPVALVLLVVLAAVPVLLSRSPETPAAATPAAAQASGSEADPVVGATDPAARDAGRRVLGREKDPFRAVRKVKPKRAGTSKAAKDGAAAAKGSGSTGGSGSGTSGSGSAGGSASGSGSGSSGSSTLGSGSGSRGSGSSATAGAKPSPRPTATPTPAPTATIAPPRQYAVPALEVRFGTVSNPDHADRRLTRLSPLPRGRTPALLYLGLLEDRRTGVFLVGDGVRVAGNGSSRPSRDRCRTLRMRRGDVAVLGAPDGGQYQVEVLTVRRRFTRDPGIARASRTRTARDGKRWLRAWGGDVPGLRYRAATGTLVKR